MAETFDKDLALADVYAAALLALASERGAVDNVRSELEELNRLVQHSRELAAFLTSAAIDPDERERSLERMFRGRLSDLVLNTLQIMNQHGRAGLLPALLRAYVLRIEDARGQVEVTVTSAVELDAAQRRQVEELAASLSGRKPLVEYVVDPTVVGGLVLQIGDWRLDNSLRRHLSVLRRRLLERTSRAMEITS